MSAATADDWIAWARRQAERANGGAGPEKHPRTVDARETVDAPPPETGAIPAAFGERQGNAERAGGLSLPETPAPAELRGDGQHQGARLPAAFPQRQGNGKRTRAPDTAPAFTERPAYAVRRGNARHRDDYSPRKPGDPPWRGRTARRSSTPEAVAAFRGARLRRGWSLTRAADETGVSRPHLSLLERGDRRPSESVAETIITAYKMTVLEADAVRDISVPWAGRDSPYRTGVEPGNW